MSQAAAAAAPRPAINIVPSFIALSLDAQIKRARARRQQAG
jgi:hypothetical protein